MKEAILTLLRENKGFVSGQELSEHFGVSRTSVWKYIRQLEEQGYEIEAVRNRGYRLCSEPDVLTEERVRRFLDTAWAGNRILVYDSIDSTNNEAKRQAENRAAQGLLVIGEEQTAGRGRRGRVWESAKGEGIFMSLLLKPNINPGCASMLTLVMGLAIRDALEEVCGLDAKIKWPNDIICSGKKICGILTEMSAQIDYINHIVIGIGINVHHTHFPQEVEAVATSIALECGKSISRAQLVASCLRRFERYYEIFVETEDLSALREQYNQQLINCGRGVRVLDYKEEYTGIAQGINAQGELLVQTADGVRQVGAGEVSVRGVYGYV